MYTRLYVTAPLPTANNDDREIERAFREMV